MEKIKYYLKVQENTGTEEEPVLVDAAGPLCVMPYSEENMELARAEAFGEVIVEDDGMPESEETPSQEDVTLDLLADHEYRLCMLELGGDTV